MTPSATWWSPALGTAVSSTAGKAPAVFRVAENVILSLLFGALAVLPLAEIVLRKTAGIGVEGSAALVRHLTFVIGMLGAAVAAREDRLLAFSASGLLAGRWSRLATLGGRAFAAAVALVLCVASLELVGAERTGGRLLAYSLPVWVVQLALPIGFGLIALRLLWHSAGHARGRVGAGLLAAALLALLAAPFAPPDKVVPGLVVLLAAMIAGAPLFAVIGGAALLLLWGAGVPIAAVAVDCYSLAANPSLAAIPLFTLAGYFLAESGAPKRLIELFDAAFGRFRGGAAVATVLACTFFTSFTGASGVAILALGGLTMPLLLAAGYRERQALGLVTGGGLPGVLLFPALPLILYAIVAKTSIESMFVGGLLPACVMLGIALWWGIRARPQSAGDVRPFDRARLARAVWAAKWELSLPVVPLATLLSGLATPVEAAAATALYALVTAAVIHREIRLYPDLPRIVTECGLLVGGILLILGVALGLTNFLVDAQVPDRAVEWVSGFIESPLVFLLALNAFLLAVGCVMDVYSAIVVVTPLVVPIGLAFGVHPVHLGAIVLANLELGYLTPPVGLNLFFASSRFRTPVLEVCRAVAPLFLALAAGVLVITYVPWLSTGLLGLVG